MSQIQKFFFAVLLLAAIAHGYPADLTATEADAAPAAAVQAVPPVPQETSPPGQIKEDSTSGPAKVTSLPPANPPKDIEETEELLDDPPKPSKHGVATVTHRKGSDGSSVTITQYTGPLTSEQFAMITAGVRQQVTSSIASGFGYQQPAYVGNGLPYYSQQHPLAPPPLHDP